MPVLTLPPSFFKKERDNAYSDWKEALPRELVQNAVDAKAKNIFLQVDEFDDHIVITCKDDGHGMSREVCDRVYFALGESHKEEDAVGGFGRARILIPFSFDDYTIRTSDYAVRGKHAEYEITTLPQQVEGFELSAYTKDADAEEILNKTRKYLAENELNVQLYLNGAPYTEKAPKGKYLRDLTYNDKPFAKVYHNEGLPGNLYIVRVNGLSMFSGYARQEKGTVIVELIRETAREVLTSNRDALRYPYSNVLSDFISELASDEKTALRPRRNPYRRLFKGHGTNNVFVAKKGDLLGKTPPVAVLKTQLRKTVQELQEVTAYSGSGEPATALSYARERVSGSGRIYSVADFMPDIPIYVDHWSEDVHAVVDRYDPRNWKFRLNRDQPHWIGCHSEVALFLAWREAIKAALLSAIDADLLPGSVQFLTGWTFCDHAEASTEMNEHTGHQRAFYLNPVTNDGKKRYDLRKYGDMQRICSCAIHEVSHMFTNHHNEKFAGVLTELAGRFPWNDTVRTMLHIKL